MKITGKTNIAGVVGWPIAHSLSPVLHGYWLEKYGIDGAMVPLAARPPEFRTVINGVRDAGFKGVNVTTPHKRAAFRLANFHDPAAKIAGTANLLVFHEDGRIEGRNTDTFGLAASLLLSFGNKAFAGKNVVVLGAGGAARAAALALNYPTKASKIYVLSRRLPAARALVRHLNEWRLGQVKGEYISGSLEDWPAIAEKSALLVNATTGGMKGMPPLFLNLKPLPMSAVVCDIVYNPLETNLLRRAKSRGHRTLDGLGMLMYQAAPSFKAFFGEMPEVTPGLRETLIKALRVRG